jgi:hypothetical protein
MVALRFKTPARTFFDRFLYACLAVFGFAGFLMARFGAAFFPGDFFTGCFFAGDFFAVDFLPDTPVAPAGFVAGLAARVTAIIWNAQFLSFRDAPPGAGPE